MLKSLILPLALVLPALGCGPGDAPAAPANAPADAPAGTTAKAQTVALESAERELRCGCKIESIGMCGNYVADGEDWLEISNPKDHGLGKMEWCKVPKEVHVKGTVAGTRDGDKIEVATLVVDGQ